MTSPRRIPVLHYLQLRNATYVHKGQININGTITSDIGSHRYDIGCCRNARRRMPRAPGCHTVSGTTTHRTAGTAAVPPGTHTRNTRTSWATRCTATSLRGTQCCSRGFCEQSWQSNWDVNMKAYRLTATWQGRWRKWWCLNKESLWDYCRTMRVGHVWNQQSHGPMIV